MAMCQNSEFIEIDCNNLGAAITNEGILRRAVDYKNGFNLDHRNGAEGAIQLIKDTGPSFVWVSLPGEKLCKDHGEWSPTGKALSGSDGTICSTAVRLPMVL